MEMTDIPEGFVRHPHSSPLTEPWEPIYSKTTPDALIVGLRLARPHTNSRGLAHGGLIATLADNTMGRNCRFHLPDGIEGAHRLVTVNLNIDYLGSATIGQWLQVETGFVKVGGSICFVQSFITADGEPCARANATFKIVRKKS